VTSLEPNVNALSWFALLWGVCCLGFFQLAGMYPIRRGGDRARDPALLVLANTALWLALSAGTLAFASFELRWTTTVIAAGLLFLFAPALLKAVPDRLRDGRAGMAIESCLLAAALAVLACIAGGPVPWLYA